MVGQEHAILTDTKYENNFIKVVYEKKILVVPYRQKILTELALLFLTIHVIVIFVSRRSAVEGFCFPDSNTTVTIVGFMENSLLRICE